MRALDELLSISNIAQLESYVSEKLQGIYDDLFLSVFEDIEPYSKSLSSFYAANSRNFAGLDFSKKTNTAFILMMADFFERFDQAASFNSILKLCHKFSIPINSRLKTSSLFLSNRIQFNEEYLTVYDEIIANLEHAYCNEEDEPQKVTYTFANYFHKVLDDTYQYDRSTAIILQTKLKESKKSKRFNFLDVPLIDELIVLDINKYDEDCSRWLNHQISKLIRKDRIFEPEVPISELLIESDTEYANLLNNIPTNFESIRNLSVRLSNNIQNPDNVRNSIGRGTYVLTTPEQMVIYLRDYGNMHKAKIESALQHIMYEITDKTIDIIDWGCGQALASMVLIDIIREKRINTVIDQVILIEPSEVCLKRGALHLKKYDQNIKVKTVLKELDQLTLQDIKVNRNNLKLHLFSNILDVERFSINNLSTLISNTQKGRNYFICISPFIDDIRSARLEFFYKYFSENFETTQYCKNINNKSGAYWNCNHYYKYHRVCENHPSCSYSDPNKNRWTRYEIVFKSQIN